MLKKENIGYIESRLLKEAGAAHAFLMRTGGVSPAPFDSLNFGGAGDASGNITLNIEAASLSLGVPLARLFNPRQVHGRSVAAAPRSMTAARAEADAAVTGDAGLPVGVLTADCAPILLYDPVNRTAAAVHAGWKGTVKGVAAEAAEQMMRLFGSEPGSLLAAIGPHIRPCCYTVGPEVRDEFIKAFGQGASAHFIEEGGTLRLDLASANAAVLLGAGLDRKNIDIVAPCTACNTGSFFSYRKEGAVTGRQLSFIMVPSGKPGSGRA